MAPAKKASNNFIKQGTILAAASLISRVIGMLYRIPMTNILGDQGGSVYSVAYEIYDVLLIVSSYSLPLALSKMVSAKNIRREYKNADKVFKCTFLVACAAGLLAASALYFGADFIEKHWFSKYVGLSLPLKVLAPTIFIVAIIGVLRGFFQGRSTMMPTAVSQILEQIVNAVVSVYASYSFMMAHNLSGRIDGWGAAGGTLGTLAGALTAFGFLAFIYLIYRPVKKRQMRRDVHTQTDSLGDVYYLIFLTILPIVLSQTVYQISGIIDFFLFGKVMGGKELTAEAVKELTGVYTTKYRLLTGVPIAISTAIASSMIPSVVASFTMKNEDELQTKMYMAVKFNMVVAFPCVMGLSLFGEPIVRMLFPGSNYELGGRLLLYGSAAILFYALSNASSAILQSVDRMRIPVIHSLISLGIHVVLVLALMQFGGMGIYALIVGNISFPLVVAVLNWLAIRRHLNYEQEWIRTFCVPFLSSICMGIVSYLVYYGIDTLLHRNGLAVLVAVLVAVPAYFASVLLMKGMNEEELVDLPLGRTLARVARFCRLV